MSAFHHTLPAGAEPEGEGEEEDEGHAEGGAEGPVAGLHELVLDDFADGGFGAAAHELADGKHADGRDEDEEDAGDDAGLGEGKDDFLERPHGPCAEIEGGFDEGVVEFFHGAIDGQDKEGQVAIDEAEDHGAGGVEHLEGFLDEMGVLEEAVEQAIGAEDGDPRVGADEEARPEGDHDEGEEEVAPALGGAADETRPPDNLRPGR